MGSPNSFSRSSSKPFPFIMRFPVPTDIAASFYDNSPPFICLPHSCMLFHICYPTAVLGPRAGKRRDNDNVPSVSCTECFPRPLVRATFIEKVDGINQELIGLWTIYSYGTDRLQLILYI